MEPAHLAWIGRPLLDADGAVFGAVADVLVDAQDRPVWAEIPRAAGRSVLVPVDGLRPTPSGLTTPYSAELLRGAPDMVVGDGPSAAEEDLLRRHFGRTPAGPPASLTPGTPAGAEVLRAAEELRIETEVRPAGTVRLRKRIATETVREQVVLHQERLHVARQPVDLTSIDSLSPSAQIGEVEYELVLRDEQVVASKVVVPREVIRVAKEVVAHTVLVEADLRHEEVDVETVDLTDTGALAGRA